DAAHHALDALGIDGALAERDLHRAHQLVAVERHAPTAPLDHGQLAELHPLEGGKAAAAIGTDAAAPDGGVILARPRVLHLRVGAATIGAPHGQPPFPVPPSRRRLAIDRKTPAQLHGTLLHVCLDGAVAVVAILGKPIEYLGDHVADGLELGDAEAARSACRRAQAN